jgi:diguanylate cyclase (GGDEF)-like protein/PAS domain S-box-containing protein
MIRSADESHARQPGKGQIDLRTRFILLSLVFSAAIIVLVAISYLGFQALSGARAYVHGESQWTKAQKQSVISLFDYAISGDPEAYSLHLESLQVIEGDRRARLTLDSEEPDFNVAREGFLAGRNHPDDVRLMIRLFLHARDLELFDRAVVAWTQGDRKFDELAQAGERLQEVVDNIGPNSAEAHELLDEILDLDKELTALEDEFSGLMGELSRLMARVLTMVVVLGALLLMIAAHLVAIRLFRTAERADRALRESEQRYRALVDQPEVGMWQLDPQGLIKYLNPAMCDLLAIDDLESVRNSTIERFISSRYRSRVLEDRARRIQGEATTSEVEMVTQTGQTRMVLVHGAPVRIGAEELLGHVGTCVDITERKRVEEQLRHQAFHDPLTGLPNRTLFMDRLEVALKRARREKSRVGVLFVDLDRFKVVNDSLGHANGDILLREAAHRIAGAAREQDTLARFGGDEFGLIVEGLIDDSDIEIPARRIIESLAPDFMIGEIKARIGASVGIAISAGEHDAADLLRYADVAMYVAKRKGGDSWHLFDAETDALQVDRLQIENQLWAAADSNELILHYQPIVHLESGRVEALEALVRWNHPERGLLQPAEFIPLAEETGAIVQIGQWVTQTAIQDLLELERRDGDKAPGSVSINISAAEFRFSDPVSAIVETVRKAGIARRRIQFEVTESLLMQDPAAIIELEKQGFTVAIDDFGTGYASLDRVRQVRFSTIKIDRAFVVNLVDSPLDRAIIESILLLGDKSGMQIIAEGIETELQQNTLIELGCHFGQGYLYAHPAPLEELRSLWSHE